MRLYRSLHITLGLLFAAGTAMAGTSTVSVDDVARYVFPANQYDRPESFTYMPDGNSYLLLSADGKKVIRYDTATGEELETVLDVAATRDSKIDHIEGYSISPDASKMLVYIDAEYVYRRSFKASYYVYNVKRNILTPLSLAHGRQMSPVFSNDSRMVAFVSDNNIYLKKLDYNTEIPVTTDGKINGIINGVPDWTYEEEFTTTCSMAWSSDNLTLCFLKYNESDVPTYSFPLYQGTCNPMNQYALYPGQFSYKYPVAGQHNSSVSLHSYDVETRKLKSIEFSDPEIEYIPRIAYASETDQLLVTTLNREQNRMEIYSVNPKSTVVKSVLVEESSTWISPATYEDLAIESDGFVMLSGRSGYEHLYRYSFTGDLIGQLTSGDFDVTAYYGTDASGGYYYQSTSSGAINRTVTYVDAKGKSVTIGEREGTTSLSFSPAMNYYVLSYSNVSSAPKYTLYNAKMKELRTIVDNESISAHYSSLPRKEFFTFDSDGYELNGYMLRPADFSPSKKYPVIMWQYSGPGSQEVLNSWKIDWDYAAVAHGFIVICVDGRGTGGRGRAFQDIVYKRLGHYESIDQINAARYAASLPYVDAARIGICGWSYGGYETLMAISQDRAPYAAAVAIAPVTDWRYYDTVYAERYMNTPQANDEGYRDSAPVNFTSRVNCPLLIMSGTADDNVHLSNTMEYVSHLQADNRLCDMLLFPNMNHSIRDCNARSLVYAKMIDFFRRNM